MKYSVRIRPKRNMRRNPLYFFILLVLFLISASSVLGVFNYTESGNFDGYYQQGTGFFNTELTEVNTRTRAISNPRNIPLVQDLDGDGINEIIVIDGSTVRLYQNSTLDILDSYIMPTSTISNTIIIDIDSDGKNEIITALEDNRSIQILEYNGTHFFQQIAIDVSTINGVTDGFMMVKCIGPNECALIFTTKKDATGVLSKVYAAFFDSTQVIQSVKLFEESVTSNIFCFPRVRSAAIGDYDGDSITEVIFNLFHNDADDGDSKGMRIFYLSLEGTNVTLEQRVDVSDVVNGQGGTVVCSGVNPNGFGDYITQPLVFDADQSPSNGLETIVGFMKDDDEFIMKSFDKNGNEIDRYPEVFDADGQLISNIIRADIFTDTGNNDFCAMGYDQEDNEINLLCASIVTGETPQTREFLLDTSDLYNISDDPADWHTMINAVQHSTIPTDGANLNEIANSYGILFVNWNENCRVQLPYHIKCLDLIFESPIEDTVLISSDVQRVEREDLLALSSTNIWYIDDKFTNSIGQISSYTVNPCIDATWKINTTVSTSITMFDADSDAVRSRAILYLDDPNQQDSGWTSYGASGTVFPFSFIANKTIASGTLRLIGQDFEHQDTNDTIDLTFSVNVNGVEFGDCLTSVDLGVEEEIDPDEATLGVNDTITSTIDEVKGAVGLRLSNSVVWLIIMAVVAGMLWVGAMKASSRGNPIDPTMVFGAIGIVEIILVIIGVKLNYFSVAVPIVLVIIGVAIISFRVRQIATGG